MASSNLQVSCELDEGPGVKAALTAINVGDRVVCAGKLGRTFVVVLGITTIAIEKASVGGSP
jgi:hypothetical protein